MKQKNTDELISRLNDRLLALRSGGAKGVIVGSFGVPYAKYHEFGTKWSEKMAWFIIRMGRENAAAPKKQRDKSKGVIEFDYSGDVLRARIKERPFVLPALPANESRIREILSQVGGEKPIGIDKALTRIGMLLQTQISRNVRDRREGEPRGPIIGRTGALLNSIRYELIK